MKGDGEAHPLLSPDRRVRRLRDLGQGQLRRASAKTPDMLPREYAREAYKRGLAYEAELGANPFKFGHGRLDRFTHRRSSTTEEDNFFGKVRAARAIADPIRFDAVITGRFAEGTGSSTRGRPAPSGLAAVWARENTREALWDAMARKEVYATTGTRLLVRVFGGLGFHRRRSRPLGLRQARL